MGMTDEVFTVIVKSLKEYLKRLQKKCLAT